MEISEFNKEELQKIEALLEASNVISSIYDNLYKLEIEGKQNTEDYQKLLNMLEEAIKIENEKYKKANLNLEERKKIYKLLLSSNKTVKFSNHECILYQKYDDKVVRRTMNILSKEIVLDINFQKEKYSTDILVKLLNSLGINITFEQMIKEMNNNKQLEIAISNDILSIFLSILKEYIENKKYSKHKNDLIKVKYFISFINQTIETHLLSYKFTLSDSTYTSSNMTSGLLGINETQYNIIREKEALINATIIIKEFLEINDSDYEKTEKNIESIIRQCFIRSLLTLMTEDSVFDLNQSFHDLVESNEYLVKHPNDRISENAIICCLKSQKYDRTKTRSLSFKLPR